LGGGSGFVRIPVGGGTSGGSVEGEGIRVAVEGCCHGELDAIYASVLETQKRNGLTIDLLLICGDFQACRNEQDLNCMAVPQKYRTMASFYKYYSGEVVAPMLTIFVGGNHEASNHLWELFHGGWVAPNIYYLGHAGVVEVGGLRIAGLSGIFKGGDYRQGHWERPPYDNGSMRSAYHVREYDIWKLMQISAPVDIFLSHDWPRGVHRHGNERRLLQSKRFLEQEVQSNTLGNPHTVPVMQMLKPDYWFAAHLHTKFAALVKHDDDGVNGLVARTKFLSLDKCLPNRDFLVLSFLSLSLADSFPLFMVGCSVSPSLSLSLLLSFPIPSSLSLSIFLSLFPSFPLSVSLSLAVVRVLSFHLPPSLPPSLFSSLPLSIPPFIPPALSCLFHSQIIL